MGPSYLFYFSCVFRSALSLFRLETNYFSTLKNGAGVRDNLNI